MYQQKTKMIFCNELFKKLSSRYWTKMSRVDIVVQYLWLSGIGSFWKDLFEVMFIQFNLSFLNSTTPRASTR